MTALHPFIGGENESDSDGDTAASQLDSSELSFLPVVYCSVNRVDSKNLQYHHQYTKIQRGSLVYYQREF